jgi:hypothetical protein
VPISVYINLLKPSGKYKFQLPEQSVTLYFVHVGFVPPGTSDAVMAQTGKEENIFVCFKRVMRY